MVPDDHPTDLSGVYDALGMVRCPECKTFWLMKFVPEYCTKCGTRVARAAGPGEEPLVQLTERMGKSKRITICPNCGERYPWKADVCYRCWSPIEHVGTLARFSRFLKRITRRNRP